MVQGLGSVLIGHRNGPPPFWAVYAKFRKRRCQKRYAQAVFDPWAQCGSQQLPPTVTRSKPQTQNPKPQNP